MNEERFSQSKKETILIVDDSEMNRCILEDILEDEFEIIQATNGAEAVSVMKNCSADLSLVMLDMVMPEMDGFDVLTLMNKYHWIESIPVIMISVENSTDYIERAYDLGVTDYIRRPFDAVSVRRRVINTINLYANQKKLVGLVADQIYEKEKTNNMLITILSHIVEFRNGESGLHVLHIRTITQALLNRLIATHKFHISREEAEMISMASALHDIGKICIPDEILNKPGRFTPEEFEIMKQHSMFGANMLASLPYKDEPLVKVAYEICRWHHERYDGKGYPDGIKGDDIPLSAQVVSVADVYDALTSERCYKKALPHEKAMEMILGGECGTFNPIILDAFKSISGYLPEELKLSTSSGKSRQDMQELTEKMLKYNEINVSEQTLGLLEHERIKYQFLTSISHEIQFDYTDEPPMVNLPQWSADKLGLPENIIDPKNNERVLSIFPRDHINAISVLIHATTPEQPVAEYECELRLDDVLRPYKIVCRSIWSSGKSTHYIGTVGKVIDIHKDEYDIDFKFMSTHDPLTGLYNHHYAKKSIMSLLNERPEGKFILAVIGLEHFKFSRNERLSQTFKDGILKFTAKKLSAALGHEDIAARLDGNTFLAFVSYDNFPEDKLVSILSGISFNYENFSVCANIGASVTENTERKYNSLYTNALKALSMLDDNNTGQYLIYNPDGMGRHSFGKA